MSLAHNNYDVILSRGGTAKLIRSAVDLPVAEISISGYDILRTIKLAQNYSGKFAIAGFSSITENAHMICDLLQYDIDILRSPVKRMLTAPFRPPKKRVYPGTV